MSVQNSQPANETTFNTSFMSREEDTNTIGRVDLDNALAESGPTVANMQRELNGQASFVGDTPEGAYDRKPTWASDSIGTPNQAVKDRVDSIQGAVETNQTAISELETDVTDIRSALGIVDGDTDMGTYTGSTISDNVDQTTINQELETAVEARIPLSEKGAPNGVATLDSGGRLPPAQLPTSAVEYKGAWNASTNTPTLIDGVGDNGDLYRVSVAGTQDLGSGSVSYGVGDAIIYNGTIWQRIPADDAVTSVNGQSGIVVLDTDDVAEGATNLYHTDARVDARIALASIDDLADVDTTTVPPNLNEALVWDGTNWVPGQAVGGSGQGKKNYFEGGDFEQDIALASVYDDGGSFVDGTGGTPSAITISQNSTGPLAGGFDLQIYKTTVSGIGEGVTLLSSNIDLIDLGKDLFLELSIDATDTNYTSGNYILNAYDVTNSAIIPIVPIANLGDNGEILKAQTTIYAKVLCNSNTQQVRVSLHCNADPVPGNDFFVFVDQAVLSPASVLVGSVITEWQSYTPTWFGGSPSIGNGILQARYRRVGDSLEAEIYLYGGSTTNWGTTIWEFSLPTGLTMNSDKLAAGNDNTQSIGPVYAVDATGVITIGNVIAAPTANRVYFFSENTTGAWRNTIPFTWTTNDWFSCRFTVPISEWSAGNLLSANEAAFKSAKSIAVKTVAQSFPNNTTTVITYSSTPESDDFAYWDSANNRFVIKKSDFYFMGASSQWASASGNRYLGFRVNGAETVFTYHDGPGATPGGDCIFDFRFLNAGDTVDSRALQNSGGALNMNAARFFIKAYPDFSAFGVYSNTSLQEAGSGLISYPIAVNAWGDLTSLTLPAGEWDLDGSVSFNSNGATTTTDVRISIALSSGSSIDPGAVFGRDYVETQKATASGSTTVLHYVRRGLVLSAPTLVYLKAAADNSVTNLRVAYKITARKVR